MPIRMRLAVVFALATAVLFTVGSVILTHSVSSGLTTSLTATLHLRADLLSQQIPESNSGKPQRINSLLLPSGSEQARSTVQVQVSGLPLSLGISNISIAVAQMVTRSGRVLAYYGGDGPRAIITPSQAAQAVSGEVTQVTRLPGIGLLLIVAAPSLGDSNVAMVMGAPLSVIRHEVTRLELVLVGTGLVLTLLSGLVAYFLTRFALKPVTKMQSAAARITTLEHWTSIHVPPTRDEIADLGVTLNALLGRLEASLSRERGFVASASHELRTPLAILRAELELAQAPGRTKADLRAAVDSAHEETIRLIRLAEQLLALARHDEHTASLMVEPTKISPLLEKYRESLEPYAKALGIKLLVDSNKELMAAVDESALRQIVFNLVENAMRFSPPNSAVTIACRAAGDKVRISVADEGPGFPKDFVPKAFDRFSRADDQRGQASGGGLGLAVVRTLVEAQHGQVGISNEAETCTEVWFTLPSPVQS